MKKTLIALSLLATSLAFSYESMENRLDTLEKEISQISARNPQETLGAAFTTSRPDTVGNNWFATLGAIYWHPKMGGTEYAFTNTSENIIFTISRGQLGEATAFNVRRPNPPHGDVKANDFSWDVGLKAGLGYKTPHDKWDIYARYTYFESNDTASVRKDDPSLIIPLKSLAALICSHAKSSVDIGYNNVDLELARSYFLSGNFSVRPHFDVKAAWIDLSQNVTYTFSNFRNTPLNGHDFKIKHGCKVFGVGPRAGLDGKLFIGHGFSLNGEIAGSILYSQFKTNHKEIWPLLDLSTSKLVGGTQYNLSDKFHQFVPFVQMMLALGWDTYLNHKRQHLSFKAGYEVQYYWRINQMSNIDQSLQYTVTQPISRAGGVTEGGFRTNPEKLSEDLMFYGITGEARLDF